MLSLIIVVVTLVQCIWSEDSSWDHVFRFVRPWYRLYTDQNYLFCIQIKALAIFIIKCDWYFENCAIKNDTPAETKQKTICDYFYDIVFVIYELMLIFMETKSSTKAKWLTRNDSKLEKKEVRKKWSSATLFLQRNYRRIHIQLTENRIRLMYDGKQQQKKINTIKKLGGKTTGLSFRMCLFCCHLLNV